MRINGGTESLMKIREKELKITNKGENMVKVKNVGLGTLAFKDDDGKLHYIKAGEEVECKYKKSQDSRLVIKSETKKKAVK